MKTIFSFLIFTFYLLIFNCNIVFSAFKDSGWGTRPISLGNTFTAVSDDATGILYNPAGTAQLRSFELNLMYGKLFMGLDSVDLGLSYASFAFPYGENSGIGVQWANFTSKDQYVENTISLNYSIKLNEIFYDMISWQIQNDVVFGVNFKYLDHSYILDERSQTDPLFASGKNGKYNLTFDVGFLHKLLQFEKSDLTVGFSAKNINEPDVGLKSKDIVPQEIRVGMAYKLERNSNLSDLLSLVDISYRNQKWGDFVNKINLHVGQELGFWDKVFNLRIGANFNELACGFGLKTPEDFSLLLQFDYAFIFPFQVKDTNGSHRFSLTFRF